jgi:hypothetical protein
MTNSANRKPGPHTKIARRGRVRLQPYVDPALALRLEAYCAATNITESAVTTAALRQYLDRTGDMTLILRRLDRLGRAVARHHRDLELLSEAFATWVQIWFAYVPDIPDDAKPAARASAGARYRKFVEHVAQVFSRGQRFLDDLPREEIANDAELQELAATDRSPPHKESA